MDNKKPANWRPTQQEAVDAWLEAQLEGRHVPLDLQDDHELTPFARGCEWRIFEPDMGFLTAHDSLAVRSFVALTVGLHPYFADEAWVFSHAIPYFEGRREDFELAFDEDDKDACTQAVTKLKTFIKRLSVALSALKAKTLPCTHEGSGGPGTTAVAFWSFAQSKGWEVPGDVAASQAQLEAQTEQQATEQGNQTPTVASAAALPSDPKEKRVALLDRFRTLGGKRPKEGGDKGTRGALAKLQRETGIDDKNLGVMLDKAIAEKAAANRWGQLAAK